MSGGLNANASSFEPAWAKKPAPAPKVSPSPGSPVHHQHHHSASSQPHHHSSFNGNAPSFIPGGGAYSSNQAPGYQPQQRHHHHQGHQHQYQGHQHQHQHQHQQQHHHHHQYLGNGSPTFGHGAPMPQVSVGHHRSHLHHHQQHHQHQHHQHQHQHQQHHHHHHHVHQDAMAAMPKPIVPAPKPTGEVGAVPSTGIAKGLVAAPSKLKNKPVLLFLGPRGAGKSTQAKLVAKKYNYLYVASGDIVRAGKQPYIELGEIIKNEFAKGNYNGLALDRFLATGQNDMYFLDYCLQQHDMQIDLVFVLMMDHDAAQDRVDTREEGGAGKKPKSYQRRMMEHRAVYETSTNLFEPLGKLRAIDCDEKDIDQIAGCINIEINEYLTKGNHTPPLPPSFLKDNKSLQLVSDFARMYQVKQDIAKVLGVDPRFADSFPGSLMTGVMDHRRFEASARILPSYYVAAKADGQRVLVVKHELGVYLFPSSYQAMYEVVPTPPSAVKEPKQLNETPGMSMTTPISYIVDAEVIAPEEGKRLAIYAFDFIFFFGLRGNKVNFGQRYEMVADYFGLTNKWGTFHAKRCVPIAKLEELMPEYDEDMPFPIDGVILQHNGYYKTPLDANVFKWKPREMCTVDFRLCDGEEDVKEKTWSFSAKVSLKNAEGAADEETFPNTTIVIPLDMVERDNLADGTVVECLKTDKKINKKIDVWEYHRARPDKLTPNRKDIAEYTAKMDHMSYNQLKQRCSYFGKK